MEENGRLGEEFVLNYERRALRRAGHRDLAERVEWVSQESVCEGYDILSYEVSGDEKWIEVKATKGNRRVFEMSDHERSTAVRQDKNTTSIGSASFVRPLQSSSSKTPRI